ncbi:hypothetical protein BDF20DRAFT_954481 [Mycotypha africana]|uniref:uncharacterized protein n=1 Tax=Mycotypha africana TaxID=64632 RepID=UPI0023014E9A|nr:uncharacterized protein BDF20DRAFT_954481 [Mycotypha africana]KAI8984361.1 hypothetical protein BDF20DRAFT_954481 [Mycotypha africana]
MSTMIFSFFARTSARTCLRPCIKLTRFPTFAYSTQSIRSNTSSIFDRKSILFNVKHLKQALERQDVVFYEAPKGVDRTFTWMYVSAGVQLLFCENEEAPVVLAPKPQRIAIAGGLVTVGIAVASLMCLYPWRYIDKLILLRGGNHVKLVTHARFVESQKYKIYPIDRLYCKQKVFTGVGKSGIEPLGATSKKSNGRTHIFINAEGERIAYMLDRKGSFMDSKLFDGLWFRNINA